MVRARHLLKTYLAREKGEIRWSDIICIARHEKKEKKKERKKKERLKKSVQDKLPTLQDFRVRLYS